MTALLPTPVALLGKLVPLTTGAVVSPAAPVVNAKLPGFVTLLPAESRRRSSTTTVYSVVGSSGLDGWKVTRRLAADIEYVPDTWTPARWSRKPEATVIGLTALSNSSTTSTLSGTASIAPGLDTISVGPVVSVENPVVNDAGIWNDIALPL